MRETGTLGWVGLGKMGGAMSPHLLGTNQPLTVFDIDAARLATLSDRGARACTSARDVATGCDVLFSTIPDDAAAASLFLHHDGVVAALEPGQTLVEMSTISPAMSAKIAAAVAARGASYLRAPVSGSVATAEKAQLTVLASGDAETYEAVLPLLARLSSRQFLVGDAEQARYLKLVINMMVGSMSALVAEALTFGLKGGLDLATMLDVVGQSVVASPLLGYKTTMLAERSYEPAFSVLQMIKDFSLITDAAAHDHTPVALTALIRQQYEEAVARGEGERDFFCLLERQAAAAGLTRAPG